MSQTQAVGAGGMPGGALYIIDYGSGNLRSVQKAFEHVGVPAVVGSAPQAIREATAQVLPGVGAFEDFAIGRKREQRPRVAVAVVFQVEHFGETGAGGFLLGP